MNKDRRAFFENSGMMYLMQFAQYIFPLITFPYLTRVLGPEKYGVMVYVYASISYFQILIDYGFMLSATKDVSENRNNKEQLGKIVGLVIKSKLLLIGVGFGFLALMVVSIPILRANAVFTYLSFIVVFLSIFLPDFLFRGIEKMGIITVRFVVSKALTTVLVFVLIKSSSDMLLIPVLNIIGSLIAILLTWISISRNFHIRVVFAPLQECWEIIKESSIYFISNLATTVYGAMNTIMIGLFAPAEQIAFWGTSLTLISAAQGLYPPITNSLYPHMVAKKDFHFVRQILSVMMPLIVIISVVVFGFANPIIRLLCGAQYIEAVPIFRALIPVLVFSFPVMLLGFPVLGIMGRVKETSMSTVVSAIFHFAGLILLVFLNQFTVLGVAILRSITEAILLMVRVTLILKYRKEYRTSD